jgi:mannose-1-phosphate guanylyltransferase/phosphomannomutase
MQAVLFADRSGKALMPLTEHTCAAMLPVVGKPLIVYALEDLTFAGLREALVVVSAHADLVEQELGDGARWGMRLEYVLARADENPGLVVRKIIGQIGEQFLMMRGDVLRTPMLKEFLARANTNRNQPVQAIYDGQPAALLLASQSDEESWRLLGDPEQLPSSPPTVPQLDLAGGKVSLIASLAQYHRANIDAAAGRFAGLIVPGREVVSGVRLGRQSRLPGSAIKGSPIFVGSRCRIDRSAELMEDVVINDDVIIDRQSTLRSAVILPHTYIGELVEVSDSIVSTNHLINAATGSVTRVVDSFLLSGLKRTARTGGLGNALNRILGLFLLVLSIPLWPMMFIASLISQPRRPLRRLRLVGNKLDHSDGIERRKWFVTVAGATPIPLLRWLPLLLAVVNGHLRLVGVEALSPESQAALDSEWERLREEAPVGLVGPVRLAMGPDIPDEEKRVAEGFYARTRSGWNDCVLLGMAVRALFQARSWIPAPRRGYHSEQELREV